MSPVTRAFLRYLSRRSSLSVLQLLGIAVGVASAIGMGLSARAALSSFERAVAFLRGRATHALSRPAGPVEETVLRKLMIDPAVAAFSPVIDRRVELASGDLVRVIGVDPFLDRDFRPQVEPREGEAEDYLFDPQMVVAANHLATRLGLAVGDELVSSHGVLRIGGFFPNPAGEPLFFMDLAHAQELFGLRGRVDRVDLILSDPEPFQERWGTGFRVLSNRQRAAAAEEMLRAFRLNLDALSLMGIFVGVFLVYNTAMFTVASRRRDAGVLISMGATRAEIAAAFLMELLLLGSVGGLLGAVLGYGLSRALTELVGGAISSIYFFLRPTPPELTVGVWGVGAALGCGSCLLGGVYPLWDLIRTDPVEALRGRGYERRAPRKTRAAGAVGGAVCLLSLSLLPAASQHIYLGFACGFGLLLGASLACGVAVLALAPWLERVWTGLCGLPGKVAVGTVRRNLGRTAVAVAAFMVALSLSVGLGLMIGSFRHTLIWWMSGQLSGELYVAPSAEVQVPEDFYAEVRGYPGVAGIDPYRNVQIAYRGSPVYLSAVAASVLKEFATFHWREGDDRSWDAVAGGAVLVSESFARRFGVRRGDTIELAAVEGLAVLEVAGVFYDYTTEHGLVMMDRSTYLLLFRDRTIDSLGIFLGSGTAAPEAVLARVREAAVQRGLTVQSRQELHRDILEVFDGTFAVTRSMRVLGILVAFFGIAGALMTLYLERRRDFGIYRALGFSTGQVAGMTLLEGLAMGAASLVLSLVVGSLFSLILIYVINLQSFHWTIFFQFLWQPYAVAAATAVAASVGAAGYPVWKVCRSYPQLQIREE